MCEHDEFESFCTVIRLMKEEGGPVTHYTAEISIRCKKCGLPFQFRGLPVGASPYSPTTDLSRQELRVPIMPPGKSIPTGLPGFFVKPGEAPADAH